MLDKLARGTFVVLLVAMIAAWVTSMAKSSASEPQHDPTEYWLC